MTGTQFETRLKMRWWGILLRILTLAVVAALVGGALNALSRSLERSAQPAGFGRGVVQGILMPMSLPNLVVGRDVAIYAPNNTGVNYKLGYTAGVNVCGLFFFSLSFWRFNRWRKSLNRQPGP